MGIWRLANIFSFANGLCGLSAIFVVISGNIVLAAHLIALAMFFDAFDGPIARWQGPTPQGKLLDRVSDRITQTIAPAVLLFIFSSFHPAAFILGIALVFTGLLRLIRSDASQEHPSSGLPLSPAALFIVTGILVNIPLTVLFGLLAVTILLGLGTFPLEVPAFLRKPVISQTNRKQLLFVALRSLPLLILALPILSVSEIWAWIIFFIMIIFMVFGISCLLRHYFFRSRRVK